MKNKLRVKINEKLTTINLEDLRLKSQKIIKELLKNNYFKKAKNICLYISKDYEVCTHDLIKKMLKEKNVFVPFMEDNQMKISQIREFSDLEKGEFGILEPKNKISYLGQIDAVIVPGLAFDKRCNRLGRGKGCYDQFLRNLPAFKMGLAFDEQIIDQMPVESHDICMDLIITDKQIIKL